MTRFQAFAILAGLLLCVAPTSAFDTVITTPPDSIEPLRTGEDGDFVYEAGTGVQLNLNGPDLPGSPVDVRFDGLIARDGGELNYNYQGPIVPQDVFALAGGTVNVLSGEIFILAAVDGGVVNVYDGTIGWLTAENGGEVVVSGGLLDGLISVPGGTVRFDGGSAGDLYVHDGSEVTFAGGAHFLESTFNQFSVYNDSLIEFRGGDIQFENLAFSSLSNDGGVLFSGSGFAIDGVPISGLQLGEQYLINARDVELSGVLADGSPFSVDVIESMSGEAPVPAALAVYPGGWVAVRLAVPEPSTALLLGLPLLTSLGVVRRI